METEEITQKLMIPALINNDLMLTKVCILGPELEVNIYGADMIGMIS
jgi:hypothetical protein